MSEKRRLTEEHLTTKVVIVEQTVYSEDECSKCTKVIGVFLTNDEAKKFISEEIKKQYGDFFKYSIEPMYVESNETLVHEIVKRDGIYNDLKDVAEFFYYSSEVLTTEQKEHILNMERELEEYHNKVFM